ncbi:MAG: hypothetical protein EBX52_04915 [Proteobacteria bacterium]|nr:hypothetical protein [Pseudomonadota bacterium]
MIHKVNPPDLQLVVSSTKATENDPGSSQGSGVAYERLPEEGSSQAETTESGSSEGAPEEKTDRKKPHLSLVPAPKQIGLGEVVREYYEKKRERMPRTDATQQYQSNEGGSSSKGLLLNRKAE